MIKINSKKILIGIVLYIPKIFGLVWLYKFLFNTKNIYDGKEILINWLITFILFMLFITTAVYTYYIKNDQKLSVAEAKEMDGWGTAIFFAFIFTVVIVPLKIYFRRKRKKENHDSIKTI